MSVAEMIAERMGVIPAVLAVFGRSRREDAYEVWTVLDEWTPGARKAVYLAQRELMDRLPETELDFNCTHLLPGERLDGLMTGVPVIYRRGIKTE